MAKAASLCKARLSFDTAISRPIVNYCHIRRDSFAKKVHLLILNKRELADSESSTVSIPASCATFSSCTQKRTLRRQLQKG